MQWLKCVPNLVPRTMRLAADNKFFPKEKVFALGLGAGPVTVRVSLEQWKNSMKFKIFWKELTDDLNILPSVWKENTAPAVFLEQPAENDLECQVPLP